MVSLLSSTAEHVYISAKSWSVVSGTWKDSTADTRQPPSNVTRLTRTLSRVAVVKENGQDKEIPQIIYYQKGVGTGLADKYFGGTVS